MNTPFDQFFHGEFQRRLNAVTEIPGTTVGPSWDRKAAWLLWVAESGDTPPPPDDFDNLLG